MESRMSTEASGLVSLYPSVLGCWNRRAADDYAALFTEKCNLVGFDGSQIDGRSEVAAHLRQIFADHPTAAYVGKVREVRFLAPEVAILRAVAGMVPPGQSDLNPAVNAIQTMVATMHEGTWTIELFHNTPAAFHGRPDLSEQLTEELRAVLRGS
ncbi:MAG: SgcJ/EcaC family oxidoreductase [Chloroflexota bacterium]